jgi:hypothetical protein
MVKPEQKLLRQEAKLAHCPMALETSALLLSFLLLSLCVWLVTVTLDAFLN